jgi:hypothetical protein
MTAISARLVASDEEKIKQKKKSSGSVPQIQNDGV